jgi:hypothetical protein
LLYQVFLVLSISVIVIPIDRSAAHPDVLSCPVVLSDPEVGFDHLQSLFPQFLLFLYLSLFSSDHALLVFLCHVLFIGDAFVKFVPNVFFAALLESCFERIKIIIPDWNDILVRFNEGGLLQLFFVVDHVLEVSNILVHRSLVCELNELVGQLLFCHDAELYEYLLDFLHSIG